MTRNKNCPGCGYHYSFRRFWTLRTLDFECPQCGTRLTTSFSRSFWATLLCAPFLAVPMSLGLTRDPWWWALLPVWAVVHLFLNYYLLNILYHKPPVFSD